MTEVKGKKSKLCKWNEQMERRCLCVKISIIKFKVTTLKKHRIITLQLLCTVVHVDRFQDCLQRTLDSQQVLLKLQLRRRLETRVLRNTIYGQV